MKFNKIRPFLILAFLVGSFPLQSADFTPESQMQSYTYSSVDSCSSEDNGPSEDEDENKKTACL
jgi:hypothetical protein